MIWNRYNTLNIIEWGETKMTAFTPTHSASDLSAVVIDFIVEFGVAILAFVTLIALVMLYVWFRKSM